MTVQTPPFLGLILRKNERTQRYIEQQIELLREISPDARAHLAEKTVCLASTPMQLTKVYTFVATNEASERKADS